MNWRGYLLSITIIALVLGAIGNSIYIKVYENIENQNFAIRLASDVKRASRGKMLLIDARIHKEGILEVWYTNAGQDTAGTGMDEVENAAMQEVIDEAIEWAMINRGVTWFKWNWTRQDRQGDMFIFQQVACEAAHLLEKNPRPNCQSSDKWMPLPKKNNRFR